MQLAAYRNKGVIAGLIRIQTRSKYSHAAVVFESSVFEAKEGVGVRVTHDGVAATLRPGCEADIFNISMTPAQELEALNFAWAQVGKPYDYTMVLRFVTRRQESRKSKGKWFCSEYAFAVAQEGGKKLFNFTEPWEVAPGLLPRSLDLTYSHTVFHKPTGIQPPMPWPRR